MRIVRITGSGFVKTGSITDGHPVEFRHWKEVVDEADFAIESAAHSEDEEAVVELWLEDPQSFRDSDSEVQTAVVRRADKLGAKYERKTASSNWDQEFADAQAHARSVLAKLGNNRF